MMIKYCIRMFSVKNYRIDVDKWLQENAYPMLLSKAHLRYKHWISETIIYTCVVFNRLHISLLQKWIIFGMVFTRKGFPFRPLTVLDNLRFY